VKEAKIQKKDEAIKDGDYVYTLAWQGVYWVSYFAFLTCFERREAA